MARRRNASSGPCNKKTLDVYAKASDLKKSRGDWSSIEPLIPEFADALLHADPHLGKLERLVRESA
jgi:hypothetical protein